MENIQGGFLNLNESFQEVFGENNLTNLNEGKKKKVLKDFFTDDIAKKIDFKKFKKYCDEAETKYDNENIDNDNYDGFVDDIVDKHDKKDGDVVVQGILAYINNLNESDGYLNLNESFSNLFEAKKKPAKKVVKKESEETSIKIQKGSDFIENYDKNKLKKLIENKIKDEPKGLEAMLTLTEVYDTEFTEDNINDICNDICETLKKNNDFSEIEINSKEDLRTLCNIIDTTINKCYKNLFNEIRPSKHRNNDIILDKYIKPFIIVELQINKNSFFKEFVKYHRETYLNDKMLKSIK